LRDAARLADRLGCHHLVVPIETAHAAFLEMLVPSFTGHDADVTEENLQSRIRGTLIMALANKFGWLVLTTGNKSELAVGYSTLYGDTAGAFAVIKDIWKLQVYELCRWKNDSAGREIILESILSKAPSAELRPGQRDDQSLPPYEVLDPLLVEIVEHDRVVSELIASGHEEATVRRIARLVDIAEFKRRQNPVGPKVSIKAFGRDRRVPMTNSYRGAK
jgi:NAD+ synthase (glutamine-hydrolysing)